MGTYRKRRRRHKSQTIYEQFKRWFKTKVLRKHKHRWTRWFNFTDRLSSPKQVYVKFCRYPGCKASRIKVVIRRVRRTRRKRR